jgi:hypothetical protein
MPWPSACGPAGGMAGAADLRRRHRRHLHAASSRPPKARPSAPWPPACWPGQGRPAAASCCEALEATAGGTAMVFMIVLGAAAYNTFLALSQLPQELAGWVGDQGLGPYAVLWAILVFYLIFGCVMDSLSMILLTIPIFFPMVSGLDFGLPPEDGDLVRHHGADRRRGRADHAAGGHEPVRHPVDGAGHQSATPTAASGPSSPATWSVSCGATSSPRPAGRDSLPRAARTR